MGQKKKIQPGSTPHIYIPTSASDRAIEWLNNQSSIGSSLLELIENYLDTSNEDNDVVTLDNKTRRAITKTVQETVNSTLEYVFKNVDLSSDKPIKINKASSDVDKLFSMPAPTFKKK